MTTTALQVDQPVSGSCSAMVQNSWMDILFLVQEPDRYGKTVWNIRLQFGNRPPWRYGPYKSKVAAQKAFGSMVKSLDSELMDVSCQLEWAGGCSGNEEF